MGASDFGKEIGLVHEAVVMGRKVGADKDFWKILAHNEEMFRKVVEIVSARPARQFYNIVYNIVVDYGRSLKQMIKAGNYDWVNKNITAEHFPVKGKGKHELSVTLFHFNRTTRSDDAIAEMNKQGFRPAKIEELLFLGEKYPDIQREFPIVSLGCVWWNPDGSRYVPCLSRRGSKRELNLGCFRNDWHDCCRFLAVRKQTLRSLRF
jgi:hypothetical protein